MAGFSFLFKILTQLDQLEKMEMVPCSGKSKFWGNLGSLLLTVEPYTINHSASPSLSFPTCLGDLLVGIGCQEIHEVPGNLCKIVIFILCKNRH